MDATSASTGNSQGPPAIRVQVRRFTAVPGAPRWAVLAAYAAIVSVVPSGLWRTAVGLGVPLGWSDAQLRSQHIPGDGTRYVISLTGLSVGAALLTLGLIYRWGEVVPRWIPALGSRRIPPLVVVVASTAGALVVMDLGIASVVHWHNVSGFADRPDSGWATLMALCYAPALLWGPLLIAATLAYWRRRHRAETTSRAIAHERR